VNQSQILKPQQRDKSQEPKKQEQPAAKKIEIPKKGGKNVKEEEKAPPIENIN
jgi:hypothetical protein